MEKKYTYPDSRVVSEASSLVVVQFEVDFALQQFRLTFRELDAAGGTVSSPQVTFGDLAKADLFARVASSLPGGTFEEKILSPQAINALLPFVPLGGVVEDV